MTLITDPVWFKEAQDDIWRYSRREIDSLFRSLDLTRPEQARDVLLSDLPLLSSVYGEQTALLGAEWYDELRYANNIPGHYRATLADPFPEEYVRNRIKYGAGHLFTETPDMIFPFLHSAMQDYVLKPGRDTLTQNALDDPQAAGWMRVTAPDACGFCKMLAGRGGVYKRDTVKFKSHDDCNCSVMPSWDPDAKEVPVSVYNAASRMDKVRERAARGDKDAQARLDLHRATTRQGIKDFG